ncbi:MAG: TRL-like family protein [Elusimicrobiota bacterium]
MKKLLFAAMALGLMVYLSGCASVSSPIMGSIYTDVKAPLMATSNSGSSKVGTSEATGILGMFATGDASIETAAKNGKITKIHHVDYHSTSVLGLFSSFTTTVYGE